MEEREEMDGELKGRKTEEKSRTKGRKRSGLKEKSAGIENELKKIKRDELKIFERKEREKEGGKRFMSGEMKGKREEEKGLMKGNETSWIEREKWRN